MKPWAPRRVRSRADRSTGRAPRLRAASLTLLCVLAALGASELGRIAHRAVVHHARCVHGRFVHVHHHADAEAGAGRAAEQPGPADERGLSRSEAADGEHQHCDALGVEPGWLPDVAPRPVANELVWLLARPGVGPRDARAAIALLRLAPKLSPPAA